MAHKQIVVISFLAVRLLLAAGAARAEDFSGKPIKLLVGASPGGTTDTMARAIATPLSTTLGRPVIVENSKPVTTSPIAGRSGNDGCRCALVTPYPRSLPARTCAAPVTKLMNITST